MAQGRADASACTALVLADTQPILTITHVTGGKTHREFPIRARWPLRQRNEDLESEHDDDGDDETEIIFSLAQGGDGRSELSNTGMAVWTASAVLAAHTARSADLRKFVRGGCALELGCGCAAGWSIACALLGSGCVLATDGEDAPLESARRNIRHNLARALDSARSSSPASASAPSSLLSQEEEEEEVRGDRRRQPPPSWQLFDVVDVLRMQWGDVAAIDAACTKMLAAATARQIPQPVDETVDNNGDDGDGDDDNDNEEDDDDDSMGTKGGVPSIPMVNAEAGAAAAAAAAAAAGKASSQKFNTIRHTGGNWLIGASDVVYFRQGHAALANTFARVVALHHLYYFHNSAEELGRGGGGEERQQQQRTRSRRPPTQANCDSNSPPPAVRIVVVNQDRGHEYEKSFFLETLAHRTFSADVLDSDADGGGWRVHVRFTVEQVSLNAAVTFGEDPAKFILFEATPAVVRVEAIVDTFGNNNSRVTKEVQSSRRDGRFGKGRGSRRQNDGRDRVHAGDEPRSDDHSPVNWRLTIQDMRTKVLPLLPSVPDDLSSESSDDSREGHGSADKDDHHDHHYGGGRGRRSRRYRPPEHMLQDFSLEDALGERSTSSKHMPVRHSGRPPTAEEEEEEEEEERMPLPPATGVTTADSGASNLELQPENAEASPAAAAAAAATASATMEELEDWAQSLNVI